MVYNILPMTRTIWFEVAGEWGGQGRTPTFEEQPLIDDDDLRIWSNIFNHTSFRKKDNVGLRRPATSRSRYNVTILLFLLTL